MRDTYLNVYIKDSTYMASLFLDLPRRACLSCHEIGSEGFGLGPVSLDGELEMYINNLVTTYPEARFQAQSVDGQIEGDIKDLISILKL